MATGRANAPLAAYVLHHWDWSESSLILDLFTRAQGRVVAVAKGAKKPSSNLRPVLLPFHPLNVWLSQADLESDVELRTLRAAEWAGGAPFADRALMSAFYVNELLMKGLARHDAHPLLFDAYADTLAALGQPEADEAAALRAFEFALLRELGLLPELAAVTQTAQALRPDERYGLHPETGLRPDPGGPLGGQWVQIQAALAHGSVEALRQACRPVAARLRAPLRAFVHYHLAHAPLRTRQVWLELQRLTPESPR